MPSSLRASRAGFTIVEIIVVIVIIGVLATLIAPKLLGRIGQAKQSTAKANAATLASQMTNLAADCGGMQGSWTIRALWERPPEVAADKWHGPYVQKEDDLKDPWGHEYLLVVPGKKNVDFDVMSYGSDDAEGGEGDAADVIAP